MNQSHSLVDKYGAHNVIRVLSPLVLDERRALLQRVVGARRKDLTVLADRFYDPHNNAAILRSVEAFGLCGMHAVPGDQGAQLSASVAQGVDKWVDFRVHQTFDAAADVIEAEGYTLIGADMYGEPPEAFSGKLCVVMGQEKPGLSAEARARCKRLIAVPMAGMVESFNVSVAAALLLYALSSRQPPELLSEVEKETLLARYLVQTVQRPATVLAELL